MADQEFNEQTDPVMPDPDTLVVAKVEPDPIIGPLPDGAGEQIAEVVVPPEKKETDVKAATEPSKKTDEGEAKAEAKAQPEPEPEGEPEPEDWKVQWDKEQQQKDQEEAKRGMSKADLRAENARMKAQLAQMEQAKAAATGEPRTGAADKPEAKIVEPDAALPELEMLPEQDNYGDPIPVNIQANRQTKILKAMLAQSEALQAQTAKVQQELEQRANLEAYLDIVDRACKGHEEIRNDLLSKVEELWKGRGYDDGYYPGPEQTADAVDSVAKGLIIKQLQAGQVKAKPAGGRGPATDTAKGGTIPPKRPALTIEPDFRKAVKQMQADGEFSNTGA